MKGAAVRPHTYRFAGFELDLRSGELRKEGRRLRLPEQPFQVLRLLVENPGEVVTREELRQKLWPGNTFVDFDHGLNNAVNRLRELLNDSSEKPRYIETIPRRGYRFIAPVDNAQSAVMQASVAGDFTQASQAVTADETNRTGASKTRPRKVWFTTAAVAIAGASLLFGLGLTWRGRRDWRSTNVTPEQAVRVSASRQMVVLPFRPTAEDSNSRAFANGLTETLAAKLGQIADRYPLEIVSAAEARAQRVNDAQEARTVLGATLVLEGSLQESGSTMRVIYSLVDTRTLRQVHSGVITADASNPFAVQDRVIEEVLNGLDIELATQDRGRLQAHETAQPQAYDSYVRARGYLQEYDRSENLDSAIGALRRSLEVDPKFALAYAGLGQAYINRYTITREPKSVEDAKNACARAAELGGSSPDGEICIGMLFNATGEYEKAAQHLERAVRLDPGRDESYRELALAYEGSKRLDDAESALRRAIALRPQHWAGYKWLGRFEAAHGRDDEAVQQFKRVVDLAPDSFSGYSNLGAVYVIQGKYPEAIDALERSIAIRPSAAALSNLGAAYFYQGRYMEAAHSYERAAQITPNQYMIFGNLAEAYQQVEGKNEESRKNYAQALKLAEQRLQVNTRDGRARLEAALYAAMLGESAKAEAYRISGLKLSYQDPEARLRSALVLAQLHEDGAALNELQRAVHAGLSVSEIRNGPAWRRFAGHPKYDAIIASEQTKSPRR